MHTDHIESRLPEYIEGTLDESLRSGVDEHLRLCSACTSELAGLRRTMEMLESRKIEGPSSGYFTTVLPRVRERLEGEESQGFFAHPLISRLALPLGLAAIALVVLLSLPFPSNDIENAQNPLKAVMHGTPNDELVDVVLDMVPMHPLTSPTVEGETSSWLGARVLRGDHLLVHADELAIAEDPSIDQTMAEDLEQLSDKDLELLVQRLGERTAI